MTTKKRPKKTLHEVALLMKASPWSAEITAVVKRWWKAHRLDLRRKGRFERHKIAFQSMVREKLDERDRIVLGHYMKLFARQHFDAGLTMGLMASFEERLSKDGPLDMGEHMSDDDWQRADKYIKSLGSPPPDPGGFEPEPLC